MAVIKANAYGHGLQHVAPTLQDEGCSNFGVTDAREGAALDALLANRSDTDITLLSGIFDADDARLCEALRLTPVITEPAQVELLRQTRFRGEVWIKIDSGMNRLGAAKPAALITRCSRNNIHVRGLMSHLACADTPEHPLNAIQTERFDTLCRALLPDARRSLLNSAGMATLPDHRHHLCRPGIALYGSQPVAGLKLDLKPVMQLCGAVMQIRQVRAGSSISYGADFVARQDMRIAVISLGYGDGLPRRYSGIGRCIRNGAELPVTGRICMDYTLLDAGDSDLKEGDSVEFWGNLIDADEIAERLGTISYELFTGINERVRRVPV